MADDLQIGETYRVASSRKGTFHGRYEYGDDTWATFTITKGRAKAMLAYNEREAGESVTVRRAWCTFTKEGEGTR